MLGGRKKFKILDETIRVLAGSQVEMRERISKLESQTKELWNRIERLSEDVNKNKAEQPEEPIDKYAKMRNSDGFLSTQAYKARKAGEGIK